jgi:DNA-directed RNA polymerase subunit omega
MGPRPNRRFTNEDDIMADYNRATMMEPPIESLLDKVDSKFTLVTLAAKRGRQINSYFNQLGEGLGHIVPPQVTSVSRKPLSIALEEVAASKIVYRQRTEEEIAAEAMAKADAAMAAAAAVREAAARAAAQAAAAGELDAAPAEESESSESDDF